MKNIINIKDMSIGKKLKVAFSTIIVLFLMVITVNLVSLFKVGGLLSTFYKTSYKSIETALDIRSCLHGLQRVVLSIASTEDPDKEAEYLAEVDKYETVIREGMDTLEERFLYNPSLVEKLREDYAIVQAHTKRFVELARVNHNQETLDVYFSEYEPAMLQMRETLSQIQDGAGTNAHTFYNSGEREKLISLISVIGIALVALAMSVWIGMKLNESLVGPIQDIENAARQMSEGNLKAMIAYEAEDELGQLADSLRKTITTLGSYVENINETLHQMANKNMLVTIDTNYIGDFAPIKDSMLHIAEEMRATLTGVNEVVKQVTIGSDHLTRAGQSLAEGAVEQSNAVQQLLQRINEVSETVTENAKKAVDVADKSESVLGEIQNGNAYMTKLLEEMDVMTNQAQEVARIIQVVEGISAQTHLLSLNATIEAARAGEHGEGFAVVASEIGKLASESTSATKDITELIEKTIAVVERGVQLADETSQVLGKVVNSSKDTSDVVSDIANASNSQAGALSEVVEGVHQIADVVESNTAIAQETSAASEKLLSQAEAVTEILNQFKI